MGWADLFSQADGATTVVVGRWTGGGVRVETALRPQHVPVRQGAVAMRYEPRR